MSYHVENDALMFFFFFFSPSLSLSFNLGILTHRQHNTLSVTIVKETLT